MKNDNVLIDKINKITEVITTDFPELNDVIHNINELDVNNLNPEESNKKLQTYYDKLVVTLRNHITKQQLDYKDQRTKSGHL